MLRDNPVFVQTVLLKQIHRIYTGMLETCPKSGENKQLTTGSRYNGSDKIEAYLSFHPLHDSVGETIDLVLALTCRECKAVFSSEIGWSDGKVIDEVVVCDMCPSCMDELDEKVERQITSLYKPLLERLTDLLGCFDED